MMRATPFRCWLALLALLVIQQATTAELTATVSPPRAAVSLVAYGNADLTVVRETRRVSLTEGETQVVLAWPGAAVDASSVRLLTPDGVKAAVAAKPPRKNDEIRWMLEAGAGTYDLQVAYFASGIEWKPYYRVLLNEGTGAVSIEGLVDLRNRSGQAFDNAEVCLVVGELRLVANLAEAAWKALPAYKDEKKGPPPAASAGLSERYVYDLGTLPHLAQEDTYTVPFMPRVELQTGVLYRFHPAKYGQEVHRLLVFRNSPGLGLGDVPLAGAQAHVREVATNGFVPRGAVAVPYTPVGEECEIDLGPSSDVTAERRVAELRRANIEFDRFGKVEGYDDHETIEVEISNWSMRPVSVEYTDAVPGVWDVASDEPFTEEGMNEVIFVLKMEPQTTHKLHYRLIKRQGKRVRLGPTRPK